MGALCTLRTGRGCYGDWGGRGSGRMIMSSTIWYANPPRGAWKTGRALTGVIDRRPEAPPPHLPAAQEALLLRRHPRPPPPTPNAHLPPPHSMAVLARQAHPKRYPDRRPPLPAPPHAQLPARHHSPRRLHRRLAAHGARRRRARPAERALGDDARDLRRQHRSPGAGERAAGRLVRDIHAGRAGRAAYA